MEVSRTEKIRFLIDFLFQPGDISWEVFKLTHKVLVKRGNDYKYEYWENLRWW